MTGPAQAAVGSQVRFEIAVTNRTAVPRDRAADYRSPRPGPGKSGRQPTQCHRACAQRFGPRGHATRQRYPGSDTAGPPLPYHRGDRQGCRSRPPTGLLDGRGRRRRAGPGTPAVPSGPSGPSDWASTGRCRRTIETASQPDPALLRGEEDGAETARRGRNGRFQHRTGQYRLAAPCETSKSSTVTMRPCCRNGHRRLPGRRRWAVLDGRRVGRAVSPPSSSAMPLQVGRRQDVQSGKATTPDGTSVESEACLEIAAGDTLPSIPPPSPARKPTTTANPAAPATGEGLNLRSSACQSGDGRQGTDLRD